MTPKERAAMQQALDFIDYFVFNGDNATKAKSISTALREALAEQAEQEPVVLSNIERDAKRYAYMMHPDFFQICDVDSRLYRYQVGIQPAVDKGFQKPINQCIEGHGETLEEAIDMAINAVPTEQAKQEPATWIEGYPKDFYAKEWFIAITIYGDRVVLKALPENYSYDFTTADGTYMKKENVKRWMQFPDSEFLPPTVAALVAAHEREKQSEQEPVARVSGYYGGRCVVESFSGAMVFPKDMALYAAPVQQVTRADLKAAFKEGFERAADLYAPKDVQEQAEPEPIEQLAWRKYCEETECGMDVRDFWEELPKSVQQRYIAKVSCSYPNCNCPFDHPGGDWCARGLSTNAAAIRARGEQ